MIKNIQKMKDDIKVMATHQKECKRNRKTVNLKGVRTMEPWEATYSALKNKYKLGLYYVAYAKLRGKDPAETYPKYKEYYTDKQIQDLVDQYPFPVEVVDSSIKKVA